MSVDAAEYGRRTLPYVSETEYRLNHKTVNIIIFKIRYLFLLIYFVKYNFYPHKDSIS